MPKPTISLIVAVDDNWLIGANNQLPWHMPADLAFFKQSTLGKPIIMGRKTWESIGRPLPGRRNLVVTRNPAYQAKGAEVCHKLDDAMDLCNDVDEIMVIGGSTLFQEALPVAKNLYLTKIYHAFEGDTWFPEIDQNDWVTEFEEAHDADVKNPHNYCFFKLCRDL